MILIDDRQGSSDLLKYRPMSELGVLCRLDSADILIPGNGPNGSTLSIGVELKSISDLISSYSTGRLQATQIRRMLEDYDILYLLYYGIYRPSPRDSRLQILKGKSWRAYSIGKRPVPYGYLESECLLTLSALGVRIKHVSNLSEAAEWLGVLYRWWDKPWKRHKGLRSFDNSREIGLMPGVDEDVTIRAKVAACLPGVGYERALSAAQYFSSIEAMMMASVEDWQQVDGIGKTVARAAVRAIRGT